ncbi:MAG: SH3 domain-containing protein [Aggregatilineales bacterium]
MFRKFLPRLMMICLLFIALSSVISAQGGQLAYGTVLTDTLNPATPIIYTFSGAENDVVTVYMIGSNDLQATLSLSNSSGQQLGFSTGDPLTPMSNDVRVTAQLPANETYIVTVNNQSSVAGMFLLSLSVAEPLLSNPLTAPTIVTIEPDSPAQQFTIAANPEIPQVLRIQNLRPSVGFSAQLQSDDGKVLASIAGGLDGTTFVIPAGVSSYIVKIDAEDSSVGAQVELAILGDALAPIATEEVQAPQNTDPNVCTITGSGVNVRSGPGINFDAIGTLNAGNQFIATGQNNGWYNGTYNGQSAWVASGVVTATGNCANLPTVNAPAAPVQQATQSTQATSTSSAPPTATNANNQQPTATVTATPTTAATAVPFAVVSLSCRYFQNDGATVDFNVTGPAGATFRIDVRQGNTTYSVDRTLNQQGFLNANHRFGQAGNSNYTAYIVYNGADIANAPC